MALDGAIALIGCGRLGSAIVEGWLAKGAVDPKRLIIISPSDKPATTAAKAAGARINPPFSELAEVGAVVLGVKPAKWREASDPLLETLSATAAIVSVMAGVRAGSLSELFGDRPIVRAMPTTGVASGQGVAAVWSATQAARGIAHDLFQRLADVIDLNEEAQMDVVTAVAGSGPAYVHAFTRALAAGGQAAGLDEASALRLARGAVRSAASAGADETLDALIARVASPGGTTEAGLRALNAADALDKAVGAAVTAALKRARELAGDQPSGDDIGR